MYQINPSSKLPTGLLLRAHLLPHAFHICLALITLTCAETHLKNSSSGFVFCQISLTQVRRRHDIWKCLAVQLGVRPIRSQLIRHPFVLGTGCHTDENASDRSAQPVGQLIESTIVGQSCQDGPRCPLCPARAFSLKRPQCFLSILFHILCISTQHGRKLPTGTTMEWTDTRSYRLEFLEKRS